MENSVFICGSRNCNGFILQQSIAMDIIDRYIEEGYRILIGDCYGIDEMVQKYLMFKGYKNVEVYTSGEVRIMVDSEWKLNECNADRELSTRDFYAFKDKVMAKNCDEILAIWDGESTATKNNIDMVERMNKKSTIVLID